MIGYSIAEASAMIAERIAERELATCGECGEVLSPRGHCLSVGACSRADRQASRQSLRRGAAASARPAAWTLGGRVD